MDYIGFPKIKEKLGISLNRIRDICLSTDIKIHKKFYTKRFIHIQDFVKIEKIVEKEKINKIEKKRIIKIKIKDIDVEKRIEKASKFKQKNNGIDIHFMKELD